MNTKSQFSMFPKSPFEVFFDEEVVIDSGGRTQTFNVSVFQSATDELYEDATIDTTRKSIDVLCKVGDWNLMRKLKRGDVITRPEHGHQKYSITDVVEDDIIGLVVKARGV